MVSISILMTHYYMTHYYRNTSFNPSTKFFEKICCKCKTCQKHSKTSRYIRHKETFSKHSWFLNILFIFQISSNRMPKLSHINNAVQQVKPHVIGIKFPKRAPWTPISKSYTYLVVYFHLRKNAKQVCLNVLVNKYE